MAKGVCLAIEIGDLHGHSIGIRYKMTQWKHNKSEITQYFLPEPFPHLLQNNLTHRPCYSCYHDWKNLTYKILSWSVGSKINFWCWLPTGQPFRSRCLKATCSHQMKAHGQPDFQSFVVASRLTGFVWVFLIAIFNLISWIYSVSQVAVQVVPVVVM